jgi:hypothetical protein
MNRANKPPTRFPTITGPIWAAALKAARARRKARQSHITQVLSRPSLATR